MTSEPAAKSPWYDVLNAKEIPSPALLVYPERVGENIRRMAALAGGPDRLRPHMKTHKMEEVIRLQLSQGIEKCKCATLAEAEVAVRGGARDILLAMQPVGPALQRFLDLQANFPEVKFSAIVDCPEIVHQMGECSMTRGVRTSLYLDINCGMNRTGITAGEGAFELYRAITETPSLRAGGLHCYDGHIREQSPSRRKELCDQAFLPVEQLTSRLRSAGFPVPVVVAGGTPTFPIHAARDSVEASPGTTVLMDDTYRQGYSDLTFLVAAVLLTRVVSKPGGNRLCLDLGHKAVGSEMPHPRVSLLGLEGARFVGHSEEHLVLESDQAARWNVGDHLYGIPTHICPTVALHDRAYTVREGRADGSWRVAARDRVLHETPGIS